ncbi:protein phosphatase 2C domain-containing protein [Nonomuraea sp. NPDC050786]|uniref:protein phosphatase 2C domain-containing protein n=1 Tax=Nonomuraea sp. NPDC050786 TaxID=3154840 RepID=UPI0033C848B5
MYEYVPGVARIHYDTVIGGRNTQADCISVCNGARALAIAIADGAGDDGDAAECAQIAAQVGAAVTASTGSPVEGMDVARTHVNGRNHYAPKLQRGVTTATMLAIASGELRLAWAGDSPAWAVRRDGEVVGLTVPSCHPCMTPCNVAEEHDESPYAESDGPWPHQHTAEADDFVRVIVASDGVTAHLPWMERDGDHVAGMLPTLAEVADPQWDGECVLRRLLEIARLGRGTQDNTTIAVVDLIPNGSDA